MSGNSSWRLEAISKAAKKRKQRSFTLKNGVNRVGKRSACEIFIPSWLCSRDHAKIIVANDKVSVEDNSRNGTYINEKHYRNEKASFKPNDIISFGFNIGQQYNIAEKELFIYRLVKDDVETIAIFDSDEEREEAEEVIPSVIDVSDEDSRHSGDECFTNINDLEVSSNSHSCGEADEVEDDEDEYLSDDLESDSESIDSKESGQFVVTKTIVNPKVDGDIETIDISDDEDEATAAPSAQKAAEGPKSDEEENGADEESEKPKAAKKPDDNAEKGTEKVKNKKKNENNEQSNGSPQAIGVLEADLPHTSNIDSRQEGASRIRKSRLNDTSAAMEKIKHMADRKQEKVRRLETAAQPLRKRRKTITEIDFKDYRSRQQNMTAEEREQMRKKRNEALALIAEEQRKKKEAEDALRPERTPFVPKVKCVPRSRGEMLSKDMLATDKSPNEQS